MPDSPGRSPGTKPALAAEAAAQRAARHVLAAGDPVGGLAEMIDAAAVEAVRAGAPVEAVIAGQVRALTATLHAFLPNDVASLTRAVRAMEDIRAGLELLRVRKVARIGGAA